VTGRTPPLVLVAHGSRDLRAAATVDRLVSRTRRARPGIAVSAAHLDHTAPHPRDALAHLAASGCREVVVLPLLLTAAYHSRVDLPAVLAQARVSHPELVVRYGSTLGPHPLLLDGLERRLRGAGVVPGDRRTGVVLAGAGSSDPAATAAVAALAGRWARRGWFGVRAAFASATGPRPDEAVADLRRAGAPRVAVASYVLADGMLPDRIRDGARAAGAEAVSRPLGAGSEVVRVVLDRYDEARDARCTADSPGYRHLHAAG